MTMYEYYFEKIKFGGLTGKPKVDYEQLIQTYACEGWRLHTFTPLPFGAGGQALEVQFIFEREKK